MKKSFLLLGLLSLSGSILHTKSKAILDEQTLEVASYKLNNNGSTTITFSNGNKRTFPEVFFDREQKTENEKRIIIALAVFIARENK